MDLRHEEGDEAQRFIALIASRFRIEERLEHESRVVRVLEEALYSFPTLNASPPEASSVSSPPISMTQPGMRSIMACSRW